VHMDAQSEAFGLIKRSSPVQLAGSGWWWLLSKISSVLSPPAHMFGLLDQAGML
jgi:hypothetical protein